MRIISILFFTLIFSYFGFSQNPGNQKRGGKRANVTIKGQIIDQLSGEGLEFATISFFSKRDTSLVGGGLTGAGGVFEIEAKSGKLFGEIEYIGYQKYTLDEIPFDREAVRAGNTLIDLGRIEISQDAETLDEVTIQAERSTNQFSLDKRVFNVGQDLSNRGGTAEELLDNVPSVTVDIDGTVNLRGSTGVRILVNGKPSRFANQQDGLKSIPADMIETVEVITNPSARYEAEGMAGIINIILKKEKRSGFNGSFNASARYPLGAGIGANLNYRKNKINWFANYNLNYRSSPGYGLLYQEVYRGDTTFISDQTRDMFRSGISNTLRGGIEYFFTEKSSLTGSVRYRVSDEENRTDLVYADYLNSIDNFLSQTNRTDIEAEDESGLEYNVDYNHQFSSREHTLRASFQYEDDLEVESNVFEQNTIGINNIINQRARNDETQRNYNFQVDYQQPLGSKDHKFEVGIRSSRRLIDNTFLVEELDNDNEWFTLTEYSNDFDYKENIQAAYAQYGNKYGKFGFQVGLRAEYAEISTELVTTNVRNFRDSLNFFPSIFLNYEFNEGNAIQTSYSRRIRRPRFWDLNPFYSYSDNRNFFSGNPLLIPEYTDSYEINYLKIWENATLTSGVFYRHTTDVISRIRRIINENLFVTQPENLGVRDDYGVEVNGSLTVKRWLRFNSNVNFFRSIIDSGTSDDRLNADTYVVSGRLMSKFTFWKDHDVQLSGRYRSPRQNPQGSNRAFFSFDFGWSKDFLPSKDLTLTLSVRDIFNSRKWRYETFGEDFYNTGEFQRRIRAINLSASYRINQKKSRGGRGDQMNDGGDDAGF